MHPSLLPLYPGRDSIEKSYNEGAAMGVSIHEVVTEMDAGRRIQQLAIRGPVAKDQATFDLSEAQAMISRTEQRLVRESLRSIQGKYVWNLSQT